MAAANSNPAFNNSAAFTLNAAKASQLNRPITEDELSDMYGRPSATPDSAGRMTYEDTIVKIVISFAILLGGAVIGWLVPILFIPALVIGLVLGLVNTFKKQPSRGLILAYAAVEGVFVGGVSQFFELLYPGIVVQATLATLTVIGVTLALFASGKIRASARATKVFLIAMVGYLAFSLLNVVLMWTGVNDNAFGLRSEPSFIFGIPWGIIIGVFVVLLAAYSLVLDFDSIKTGVQRGAPRIFAWQAAFGVMVTVVWLYLEILRIIGIARN